MLWRVAPFEAKHLSMMVPQPRQKLPPDEHREALESPFGYAWTGFVDDRPVACAGVVELWRDRGQAWALLDVTAGRHMMRITRAIRHQLDALPFRRIEMAVDVDFPEAIRWALLLGFNLETPQPMKAYTPDGRACYQFARIR